MITTARYKPRRRFGLTLIEAVLSLTLLSIVMVSVGSAMLFAANATPGQDSAVSVSLRDQQAIARIVEDLSLAMYVSEASATATTFVVPDRTGDGVPDRIRYAWSGQPGDPLQYTLNGVGPVTMIEAVQDFAIGFEATDMVTTLPGPVRYGSERLVFSFTNTLLSGGASVSADDHVGQVFTPALSSTAAGFIPTRISFYGQLEDAGDQAVDVSLNEVSGSDAGSHVFASASISGTSLPSSYDWVPASFDSAFPVPVDTPLALVFESSSLDDDVVTLRYNVSLGGGLVTSSNGGANWSYSSLNALCLQVYGKEIYRDPDLHVTRKRYRSATVNLGTTASGSVKRSVRLHQGPTKLDHYWYADFSGRPTSIDLNTDGIQDWNLFSGSITDTHLANGVWPIDGLMRTWPAQVYNGVVTIEARLRSTSGDGPGLYGPYSGDGSDLLPLVTQLRQDGSGGQELIIYNSIQPTNAIVAVTDLPQGWIDVRLTLVTTENLLTVEVNGQVAGSVRLTRVVNSTVNRSLSIRPIGTDGEIDMIRVGVGGTSVRSDDSGGLITTTLNLLGL